MNAGTQGQIHEIRRNLTYLLQPHIGIKNKKNPLPEYLREPVPTWFKEKGNDSTNGILKALSTLKKIYNLDFLTLSHESIPHPCASSLISHRE